MMYIKRFPCLILPCFILASFYFPEVLAQDIIVEDIEVIDLKSRSVVGKYVVGEEGLELGSVYLIDRDYFVFLKFRSLLGQTRLFDILNIYLARDCIFLTYIETLLYLTNECSKDDPLPMKQCTDIFHANDLFCYSHYDGETSKPKGNS